MSAKDSRPADDDGFPRPGAAEDALPRPGADEDAAFAGLGSTDLPPRVPGSLVARLRAEPWRAPETLALAAAEQQGPAAAAWMARQHGVSSAEAARRAVKVHARWARLGGAATGLGGLATVLPDMIALAWIQSRMVFFIAAAHGFDPRDPMRPAELLVLFDLYPDPVSARAALDGLGRSMTGALVDRTLSSDGRLVERLTRMAGKETATRLGGRVVPGVASVVNAVQNESSTRALSRLAIRFYGG
jgi:uncharacterized protein (DUF697 family)